MQASIDLKKAIEGGAASSERKDGLPAAPVSADDEKAVENSTETGNKRWLSKEDWRTYRHKKKTTGDQKRDDEWFGKFKNVVDGKEGGKEGGGDGAGPDSGIAAEKTSESSAPPAMDTSTDVGSSARQAPSGDGSSVATAALAVKGEVSVGGDGVTVDNGSPEVLSEAASSPADVSGVKEGEEGKTTAKEPEKALLLRELRTRCEIALCRAIDEATTSYVSYSAYKGRR